MTPADQGNKIMVVFLLMNRQMRVKMSLARIQRMWGLRIMQSGRWMVLAAVVLFCLVDQIVACPTCKDAISGSANYIRGYFWSILFMMSMPFLIFGSLGGYWYLEIRRARNRQQAVDATANETT